MSNDSVIWNAVPENSTEIPLQTEEQDDGYGLLLVILAIFLVGTLIIIAFFVVACRHRSHGGCSRASDDPEKTTTYTESQPTHEITIQVDESDCLSMVSSHDQETERFLSTGPTGRRVSFNEAALFDHSKKAQEKGRRYTLTEGDFHHLKNARLTNLHIPPPALKIVTIHECDSAENTVTVTTRPAAKSALSIFQPMLCPLPQTALTGLSGSPGRALPGDALNSMMDTSFCEGAPAPGATETGVRSGGVMAAGPRGGGSSVGEGTMVGNGASPAASGGADSPTPVLQLLSKLRRHASLEGASPYFKIKKWKLDSSQRASSLDTRGSPKRRHFQRQRAASESMDHGDAEAHRIDLIQYIAHSKEATLLPRQPSTRLLSPPSTPPPSLGRLEVEVVVEPGGGDCGPGEVGSSFHPQEMPSGSRRECAGSPNPPQTQDPQSLYRDIWTLRASLEQYAASDQGSNNDRSSVYSDADSVCSLGGRTERDRFPSYSSQDLGDEVEMLEEDKSEVQRSKRETTELERSDAESGTRKLLQMDSGYASIEAPSRGPEDLRLFGSSSVIASSKDRTAHEKRHHFTNAGRTGTIGESFELHLFEEEPEDDLLLGAGRAISPAADADSLTWLAYGQMITPQDAVEPPEQPLTLHERDYSIDEKTDALFHEFLRHDPQFDQQESPRKYRSRIHLRKQWQRHKQWSDPGVRHFQSSFERHRTPLRRGESVNYPLETSYHSPLPRIVSAPDEEAGDGAPETPTLQNPGKNRTVPSCEVHMPSSPLIHPAAAEKGPQGRSDPQEDRKRPGQLPQTPAEHSPPQLPDFLGFGPQTITAEVTDKLTANLNETLLRSPHRTKEPAAEGGTLKATHASPDHSPV